jgi:DNA-binding cell septation regulator SpoVG
MNTTQSVPSWIIAQVGAEITRDLALHSVSADGNCFFESIRLILGSVGLVRSVEELRRVVAYPVLNSADALTNATIQTWWELFTAGQKEKDFGLIEEYKHMCHLPPDVTFPLSPEHRQILHETMLKKYYWGEQHACRVIEEQTQMRFLLFNGQFQKPMLDWFQSDQLQPQHYCLLYNSCQHFNPISYRGKFIFRWQELPVALQTFFSRAAVPVK